MSFHLNYLGFVWTSFHLNYLGFVIISVLTLIVVDRDLVPGRIKPQTIKLLFVASSLSKLCVSKFTHKNIQFCRWQFILMHVVKFDLRQMGGFFRVPQFPPPIKLTTTI
jgi:hypothetical protein